MKKLKKPLLVSMMAAMLMMMPACKTLDEDDDIEFVSLTAKQVPQFDNYDEVTFLAVVRVKTFAVTTIIMKFYLNFVESTRTEALIDSNGQWLDIGLSAADLAPSPGTYEVRVECTLVSTGKTVSGTTTIVVD